ncbi:MAG: molecular chaperone TorD family protein [Acidiferrobacterales bacterium]|nr:molecular chaperone TorD family protein [Acidiferrobacterales bacterium]
MNIRQEKPSEDFRFRANYYYLLSKLLAEPPAKATLKSVALFGVSTTEASNRFLLTLNALADAARDTTDIQTLDDEYHDLFIGVGRGELVPYGSWYVTGMLMDKPLSLIRQDLKALGIERIKNNREPEDHVAALFDIMGILIECDDEYQFKAQQTMFKKHLRPWIRRFFKDLAVARKANFYKKVGEFGIEFIDFETEYLEMSV